jgi:hypothetical protein
VMAEVYAYKFVTRKICKKMTKEKVRFWGSSEQNMLHLIRYISLNNDKFLDNLIFSDKAAFRIGDEVNIHSTSMC